MVRDLSLTSDAGLGSKPNLGSAPRTGDFTSAASERKSLGGDDAGRNEPPTKPSSPVFEPMKIATNPLGNASLRGIKVACFYPWEAFDATGAWSRFSSLWKFLLGEGAEVTLAFLEKGQDAHLKGFSVRYLGESPAWKDAEAMAQVLKASPDLRQCSPVAIDFILRFGREVYLQSALTAPWIESLVREHDVVTCDYPMFAALLSPVCKQWGRPFVVTCLDLLFEAHGSTPKEKELLQRREVAALRSADAVVFCNDGERQIFAKLGGIQGVTVLNTGDALSVIPGKEAESLAAVKAALKITTAGYCLFVGSAHGPNAEAVAEIRRLAREMPSLTFVVAGKCCDPVVEGNFVAVGFCGESLLDSLYRGALAVIVPLLHGTGNSVKLFQAFTYGKAIVSTPVGARGYNVADGRELLIVPQPSGFGAALRRLEQEESVRTELARSAREYALRLDFRSHFQPYAAIILRLLNRAPTTASRASRSLVLVDNNLTDRIGHHCNYALALKAQCTLDDVPFSALVKRTAEPAVLAELSALGTFSQGIHEDALENPYPAEWGAIRGTYDFLLANDRFAQELEAGLVRRVQPGDVVFLPNATPRQMLGLALLLTKKPIYQSLQFVLILRFSVFGVSGPLSARKPVLDKESAEKYAMALKILHRADKLSSVRLATDSDGLAKEFKGISEKPIEVLPIPHTTHRVAPSAAPEIKAKSPGKIRVVYLGDAREEKGFELLPAVVRACHGVPNVEFVFQAYVSSYYHQRMVGVIDELARLKFAQVHLVRSSLSPDAYQALLESADLVLLPYDSVTYRARTSGPFVEAICASKPVIVPANSWMSGQLGTSAAGVTFASGSAQDLTRAVGSTLAELSRHREAAAQLGEKFRTYHNPANFLRQLLQITS